MSVVVENCFERMNRISGFMEKVDILNSRRIITMPGQGREYRASGRLIRSRKYSDEEGELPTNYTNLHERKLAVVFLWLRR